jgi:hypothetical protein
MTCLRLTAFLATGLFAGAAHAMLLPDPLIMPALPGVLSVAHQTDRRLERHAQDIHAEQLHRDWLNQQNTSRQNRQAATRSEEIRRQGGTR